LNILQKTKDMNINKMAIFMLTTCLSLASVAAQQPTTIHDPNAQVRTVGDFHGIKVSSGIHLYLNQGGSNTVAVGASDPESRDRIRTEVKNGILHIYYENQGWSFRDLTGRELRAYVSCSQLDNLDVSGGAHCDVDGTLKSSNLAMDFSSGARFTGKVEAGDLKIDQSSGAHTTISGTAARLKAEASSGGHLYGYDLQADDCSIEASSGGSVDITVQKTMAASANSGGHIHYQGAGSIRDVHTSSGGSVSKQ
jgi:Putative auto-transporter adhesin, head GIN domain